MARRFQFSLQTLLRVREIRERDAQRKVAAQRAALARLDQLDRQCQELISRQQSELLHLQEQALIDPGALSRGRAWLAHLRNSLFQRQVQRQQMLVELEKLLSAYREARRDARAVARLRERRWEEYRQDRARQEQAEADELAQQLHTRALAEQMCAADAVPARQIAGEV